MPIIATEQFSNWGRAAVNRFNKTPEQIQTEIIKALENKLSVEFKDYSQWQRIPLLKPTLPLPQKTTIKVTKLRKDSRPLTGVSGTSCSSLCLHPWNKKPQVADNTEDLKAQERVEILKLHLEAKQRSLKEYKHLCNYLKIENDFMQSQIDSVSCDKHGRVTKLLEKYQKYNAAAKMLEKAHAVVGHQTTDDLKRVSKQLNDELTGLEKKVLFIEAQLRNLLQDLQTLRTYKDKEYPVKLMQIAKLKHNVHKLATSQKNDEHELMLMTKGEYIKMSDERKLRINDITETAIDEAFNAMIPAGLQHMAWHNTVLEYEVEQHKKEIWDLKGEIEIMEQEIQNVKQNARFHQKRFGFPENIPPRKICGPDEDVILDIQTWKILPL